MKTLTDTVTLKHGAKLNDRIVLAPMVTWGGTDSGDVTQEQLDYYARRSQVAGMIITEASYVDPEGIAFKGELGISSDRYLPGLKKLAKTVKKDGAKAIIQLHHGGREASVYYDRGGLPLVPSQMDFPFMVKTLVDQYQFPNILADVGYLSRKLKSELAKLGINFWTPKRRNMLHGKANDYLLMRNRRYIETVFSQWNDIFNLEKNRAHSLSGFQTIIEQCLLVYTLKKIN